MAELKTRILVVDDDLRLRDMLTRYLGEQGFEVRAAGDAPAMDKQLSRERYDLIVLDLMMPGEDGLSICRRLRTQNAPPAIIMLTAKGDDVDRIVGLEMGADDYLPKPFNPRELVARINAVLRRKSASGPPGAPASSPAPSARRTAAASPALAPGAITEFDNLIECIFTATNQTNTRRFFRAGDRDGDGAGTATAAATAASSLLQHQK